MEDLSKLFVCRICLLWAVFGVEVVHLKTMTRRSRQRVLSRTRTNIEEIFGLMRMSKKMVGVVVRVVKMVLVFYRVTGWEVGVLRVRSGLLDLMVEVEGQLGDLKRR